MSTKEIINNIKKSLFIIVYLADFKLKLCSKIKYKLLFYISEFIV